MEEVTEIEEGEIVEGQLLTLLVHDLDEHTKYLDCKIAELLGNCQKDFEGSLFDEKLFSMVGVFGSFLPRHVREPVLLTAEIVINQNSETGNLNGSDCCDDTDEKQGRWIDFRLNLPKGTNKIAKKMFCGGFRLDYNSSASTDDDANNTLSASEDGLLSPLGGKLDRPLSDVFVGVGRKDSSRPSVREVPTEFSKDSTEQGLKDVKAEKKAGKEGGIEPKAVNKEGPRHWRSISNAGDFRGPGEDDIGDQPPAPEPSLMHLPPAAPAGVIVHAGQLVLDRWVRCDNCRRWRLLIPTIYPEDLPDNWLCKMMTWLPGRNNCKYSEDVTTAAVYKVLTEGHQNPTLAQVNPSLEGQQHPLPRPLAAPSALIPDNKMLDSKPVKVNRSCSKQGTGKKVIAGTLKNSALNMRRIEANEGKNRSLNDVSQHPDDHQSERTDSTVAADHGRYGHVPVDNIAKIKQKEKSMSMWGNEGDDFHPHKHVVREDKTDSVVGKRKKKPECVEEEFDNLRPGKKSRDGIHNIRAVEAVGRSRLQAVRDRMAYGDYLDNHARLSHEISEIARAYGPQSFEERARERADDSPNGESPPPGFGTLQKKEKEHYRSLIGIGTTVPQSSDHDREFRGSGRDPGRKTASGRGRDRYATTNCRGGADFRKLDKNRPGRADERFWEEGRETRAVRSASYFRGQRFDSQLRRGRCC